MISSCMAAGALPVLWWMVRFLELTRVCPIVLVALYSCSMRCKVLRKARHGVFPVMRSRLKDVSQILGSGGYHGEAYNKLRQIGSALDSVVQLVGEGGHRKHPRPWRAFGADLAGSV